MSPPPRQSPAGPLGLDPVVLGTAFCVFSALGYSAANVCLRDLAVQDNRVLTICVKESVTVAVVGPWLLYWAWRGVRLMPGWKAMAALVAVGLFAQLGGNLPVIWAMNVVGLAVAVPVALGVNLVASAAFGRMFLGERVSRRSMAAIGVLVLALVFLGLGAVSSKAAEPGDVQAAVEPDPPRFGPLAAVVATAGACLTGIAFATLAVVIRRSVTSDVSPFAVMFLITGAGVVSLGPISLATLGVRGIAVTPAGDLAVMLASGVFNLVAFFAITKGLQLTTVVHANVLLNASQVAIAFVAGMALFAERPTPAKLIGVSLTVVGMILIDRPAGREETVAELESRA